MSIEYLIWAVLKKDHLNIYERHEIADLLKQLIKENDDVSKND